MSHKKTSLQDIARSLGLSKSTVSFVLNGKGDQYNISPETQKLIRDKAAELNYVPNFFAKGLREGKTKTVGLVISDIADTFYGELCKIVQQELYQEGYNVFIVNTNDSPELETELVQELINRSIDGLILAPCNPIDNLRPILDSTPIPVVFMDRVGDVDGDFVGIDYYEEAYRLVNRFSQKPHLLGIVFQEDQIGTMSRRIDGARKACEEQDIPYELIHVRDIVSLNRLVAARMDSVLALDSKVALAALAQLKSLAVRIPEEVRFISFGGMEAFPHFTPAITALYQPIAEIARHTVIQLMSRLSVEQRRGNHILLPAVFDERESN